MAASSACAFRLAFQTQTGLKPKPLAAKKKHGSMTKARDHEPYRRSNCYSNCWHQGLFSPPPPPEPSGPRPASFRRFPCEKSEIFRSFRKRNQGQEGHKLNTCSQSCLRCSSSLRLAAASAFLLSCSAFLFWAGSSRTSCGTASNSFGTDLALKAPLPVLHLHGFYFFSLDNSIVFQTRTFQQKLHCHAWPSLRLHKDMQEAPSRTKARPRIGKRQAASCNRLCYTWTLKKS